jgi:hypothetical protein
MPKKLARQPGVLSLVRIFAQYPPVQEGFTRQFKKAFWFQAAMYFSPYLMIVALVLMGLQLAYAFYQLATFVL